MLHFRFENADQKFAIRIFNVRNKKIKSRMHCVSHESGRRRQSLQSIVPCDLGMYATLVITVEARSSGQAHNLPPPTGTLLKPVDIGVFPNAAFTGRSWNQARHGPRISRHGLKRSGDAP